MGILVMIHVAGEEAVLGEVETLPNPLDNSVLVHKVRRRDGKPVHYLAPGVTTVLWPLSRLTFLEVLPVRAARPESLESADLAGSAEPRTAPEPGFAPEPGLTSPNPAAPSHSVGLDGASAPPEPAAPPIRHGGLLGQRLGPSGQRSR